MAKKCDALGKGRPHEWTWAASEKIRHMYDSRGQITTSALITVQVLEPFNWFLLRSEAVWGLLHLLYYSPA